MSELHPASSCVHRTPPPPRAAPCPLSCHVPATPPRDDAAELARRRCETVDAHCSRVYGPSAALARFRFGEADGSALHGYVAFRQETPTSATLVRVRLAGLVPGTRHAMHIHEYGTVERGCASLGRHYNPHGKQHGSVHLDGAERHVGDLINNLPRADVHGEVNVQFRDELVQLRGPYSVVGRALVVHDGVDDLGRGPTPESRISGNAGARIACAVIERAEAV